MQDSVGGVGDEIEVVVHMEFHVLEYAIEVVFWCEWGL